MDEQPIYEPKDPSLMESLEIARKKREQREPRATDPNTVVLSGQELENRLDHARERQQTVRVTEPKYVRITLENFFARPAGENYRELTRALLLNKKLKEDLADLTGRAELVEDSYQDDLVVTYQVGQNPFTMDDLLKKATPRTLYETIAKKGKLATLVRSPTGMLKEADLFYQARSLDVKTNPMDKETAEELLGLISKKSWAPKAVGYSLDFHSIVCKPGNERLKLTDIPNGSLALRGVGDGNYILMGKVTGCRDGVLRPVILGLEKLAPEVGYSIFDYQ